jgi:hypothetical protein
MKKPNRILRYLSSLLSLVLILCALSPALVGCTDKSEAEKMRERVALKSKNFTIDCSLMAYMFVSSALKMSGDIPQSVLDEKGFDMELDFNEQIYEGDMTWFDLFMEGAIADAKTMLICCEYAREKGIELTDEDNAAVESEITNMRIEIALQDGREINDYFATLYRGYFELEDMRRMLKLNRLSSYGYTALVDDIEASVSDGDVIAYANSLEGFEKDESATRLLCAILANPDDFNNLDEVKPLYDELCASLIGKTSEGDKIKTFEAFAKKYNASSEYLYRNVSPGDMIEEIDAWLFDSSRMSGDTGIVHTDYGYHILYYVGEDDPLWMSIARTKLLDLRYDETLKQKLEAYGVEVKGENCHLLDF